MKRISIREGNLPDKIRAFVISPALMSGQTKPPEVYECKPDELLKYADENNAVTQPLRPKTINQGGRFDGHWYLAGYAQEEYQGGIYVPVRKVLFAEVTPEWLRTKGQARLKQRREREESEKHANELRTANKRRVRSGGY